MRRIAVAGHVCVDVAPRVGRILGVEPGALLEVGPATITIGGAVGNTGRDLAALGADVLAYTAIGDDALGSLVQLELSGGSFSGVAQVIAGASTSYSIILEPPGVDRAIWHNVGANAHFDGCAGGGEAFDLSEVDVFHLGYPPLLPALLMRDGEPLRALLAGARRMGVTTSVDLAVVDPHSQVATLDWEGILTQMATECDVLSPSFDDLTSALRIEEQYSPRLVDQLAEQLIEWGAAVVVITAGEHGSIVKTASASRIARAGRALSARAEEWADQSIRTQPVPLRRRVTTNGAGDASTAGLLFGIVADLSLDDCMRLAAACSAATIGGNSTSPEAVLGVCGELAHVFH